MNLHLLFWLLPVAFMGLLLIRFFKKSNNLNDSSVSDTLNQDIAHSKKKGYRLLISTFVFIGTIIISGYFIPYKKMFSVFRDNEEKVKRQCSTIICIDDFAEMVGKDINYIADVFHSKGLEYYRENERVYFADVTYLGSRFINQIEENKIPEYGYTEYSEHNSINYVINDKTKYLNLIETIKSVRALALSPENYENFDQYSNTFKIHGIYKYKNCVFVDYGYLMVDYGYTISVFDFGVLKSKNSVESSK